MSSAASKIRSVVLEPGEFHFGGGHRWIGGKHLMPEQAEIQKFLSGLRELKASAFPKRCACCAREYASAAEFILATQAPQSNCGGLKPGEDDDGYPIIELFRNCACGSTLMESFMIVAT